MAKKIKMIWDFPGINGKPTAEHHIVHLKEFAATEGLDALFGTEALSPMHHIAYMVVDQFTANALRPRLKPNRGQYYEV